MITQRAMLAAVHISAWTATKHDRKVSREVADQNGARERAGRYNKQLLMGASKLDELRSLAGQIRQHFYKVTLPWSDEGLRLLPSHFLFELKAKMREFEREFTEAVESFLDVYPAYIQEARSELGGLFRAEDYPSAEKLRDKFSVKLDILPFPAGEDFRVEMSAEEHARMAREIDADTKEKLAKGTEELWKRLRLVVSNMVERLNEPESRFHATLVTNIDDLVSVLPKLNVTQNPELDRFAAQVHASLCSYSAKELKTDDQLRGETAAQAAEIVAEIDSVLDGRRSNVVSFPNAEPQVEDIFTHMSAYMGAPAA
jgi:hypothetical protein